MKADSTYPNPMPGYHSARLHPQSLFRRFAYGKDKLGPGIDVVYGFPSSRAQIPGRGKSRIQAVRFDRDAYTPRQARTWLKRHGFEPIRFERARSTNPSSSVTSPDYWKTREGKEFAGKVVDINKRLQGTQKVTNKRVASGVLTADFSKRLDFIPSFLGCASSKVLHTAKVAQWLNVVQYLSPADRGATAFAHLYPEMVEPLLKQLQKAAREDAAWKVFATWRQKALDGVLKQLREIERAPIGPNYTLPEWGNRIKPLTLCPWASPNCRSVCLNTSGQGGMTRTGALEKLVLSMKQSGIKDGVTKTNDYSYFFLKGYKAFYGGENNTVTAARMRRSHAVWLAWALQGPIQNVYNDMLFSEAMAYKAEADRLGVPMALRLNGTSDFPVHRLKLTNGKNLVLELGKRGIVCYDYTKDYRRMKDWMEARAWAGYDKQKGFIKSKARMKSGWPSNYHLVFSWSEVNGELALKVLQQGGNVVMVFRRSVAVKNRDKLKLPTVGMGKGALPTQIHLAQLSKNPADHNWTATVVDGDLTDMRFADPYAIGTKNGGIVVALVAKGGAKKAYDLDEQERIKLYRQFVNPVALKQMGDQVSAQVRTNPGEDTVRRALPVVDPDVYNNATSFVDSFVISTTAAGT